MAHSIPPLNAIRCFEAAARHLSFSRAAEELGMTQAAVSYQIKALEDRVGEPLFLRGARGVTLTDNGRRIAPLIGEAFLQLRAAFALIGDDTNAILKLTTLTTFAANWLVPKLGGFQLQHPEIAVRLDASNRVVDFAREDFDIGIRSGNGRWPGLAAEELFPAAFTPMMTPALLKHTFQGVDGTCGIAFHPQQLSEQHPNGIFQRVALEPHANNGQRLVDLSREHA